LCLEATHVNSFLVKQSLRNTAFLTFSLSASKLFDQAGPLS